MEYRERDSIGGKNAGHSTVANSRKPQVGFLADRIPDLGKMCCLFVYMCRPEPGVCTSKQQPGK